MLHTLARKTLATLATGAMATAALVVIAQPAVATDGDPLQLGYLQVTPSSGQIDVSDSVGWLTSAFTNEGEVCPDGHRARSGFYSKVDGVLDTNPIAGQIRAGITYAGSHGGINDGETNILRTADLVSNAQAAFPWEEVAPNGGVVELRHACQAAAQYAPTSDPYYQVTIEVQPGGAWVVIQQGSPAGPSAYDSSESDINVDVPEATTTTPPTGLKISVKPGPVTLTGPATREAGEVWSATGTLDNVTVNDDRRDSAAAGWTLNGRASAFTATDKDPIPASNLGWTPAKVSGAGAAGAAVAPGVAGGLSTDKPLATGTASDDVDVKT
ncbi:MAG: hypothetical protein LBK95_13390, partial [Bifidobacteriaceae bacterium]|nr:hypothetical protein [Bifidobacteriaceae bacterium]